MACLCIFYSASCCRTGIICPVTNLSCHSPACIKQLQTPTPIPSKSEVLKLLLSLEKVVTLISSSGGYSRLQTKLFLSVIWFLLTAMQRLNLWFAAHPEWLKLCLFQGTKATKWFRADFVFSQSQEVQKNISSWDSDFTPAQNLASNLILNFPDVPDSRPD